MNINAKGFRTGAIFYFLFTLSAVLAEAAQYTVSPTGAAGGAQPWNLQYALSGGGGAIQPGDTIWITTGTYGAGGTSRFTSSLSGTSGSPIIVRQNLGDKAIINGGIDQIGSYVWFWGFEITNTSDLGRGSTGVRPSGLVLNGHGNKAINLMVHDAGDPGISFLNQEGGGEINGCLLWANGYSDSFGNVFGAGVDGHNDSGSVLLQDNMSFWNYSNGLRAFGQTDPVVGFSFQNNTSFNNGAEDIFAATTVPGNPVRGLAIQNNATFRNNIFPGGSGTTTAGIRAGWNYAIDNQDITIMGNTVVGSVALSTGVVSLYDFHSLTFTNNVVVSSGGLVQTWISTQPAQTTAWDDNLYYGKSQVVASTFPIVVMSSSAFSLETASYTYVSDAFGVVISTVFFGPAVSTYTFDEWQSSTSYDTFSDFSPVTPALNNIMVRPNKYEPGSRAQVVLYNWSRDGEPTIDLSGAGLVDGASYEMLDAQNVDGVPAKVLLAYTTNSSRTFFVYRTGQPAQTLDLRNQSMSSPVGSLQGSPPNFTVQHTPLDFGTFIVLKTSDPIPAPVLAAEPTNFSGRGVVIGSSVSTPIPVWVENLGATGTLLHWTVSSDVSWATLSQTSGTVAAGDSQQINVTMDTTQLPLGYGGANILFQDTDPSPVVSSQTIHLLVNVVPVPPPPPPSPDPIPVINVDPYVTSGSMATVTYPNTVLEYFWTISGVASIPTTGAPNVIAAPSGFTSSFQMDNNQLAFAPLMLAPGIYQLQVRAAEQTRISDPGVAYITVVGSGLTGFHVYPNPWRSDRHSGTPHITFDTLPVDTTIKIFTISARHVKTLTGNGQINWDLDNDSGERVASGIYLYLITDGQGNKSRGKLAVIR